MTRGDWIVLALGLRSICTNHLLLLFLVVILGASEAPRADELAWERPWKCGGPCVREQCWYEVYSRPCGDKTWLLLGDTRDLNRAAYCAVPATVKPRMPNPPMVPGHCTDPFLWVPWVHTTTWPVPDDGRCREWTVAACSLDGGCSEKGWDETPCDPTRTQTLTCPPQGRVIRGPGFCVVSGDGS